MSEAMTPMPQYRSHKKVWALQIASVTLIGCDSTTDENPIVEVTFADPLFAARKFNLRGKPTPEAGWYFIQYEDGYESFSPSKVFEQGHRKITGDLAGDIVLQASSKHRQHTGNILDVMHTLSCIRDGQVHDAKASANACFKVLEDYLEKVK